MFCAAMWSGNPSTPSLRGRENVVFPKFRYGLQERASGSVNEHQEPRIDLICYPHRNTLVKKRCLVLSAFHLIDPFARLIDDASTRAIT